MPQRIEFHSRSSAALGNAQIRSNFRQAMDGLMDKRRAAFPDGEELRRLRLRASEIRANALC